MSFLTLNGDDVKGTIWLGEVDGPDAAPPILEGEDITVSVERTDHDEIAIHGTVPGDDNALVSMYLTLQQAEFIAASILRERAR